MGLTERHWFENEDVPENYEWVLEDAVYNSRTNKKYDDDIVRCKDCKNWIPGYITDHDDFIPPKCGKYQQMVGHSADDYCSLAERKEGQ